MFSNNSLHTFEDAADIIVKSKQKYITATRGDTALADYASLYLKHMVPNVISASSACRRLISSSTSARKTAC